MCWFWPSRILAWNLAVSIAPWWNLLSGGGLKKTSACWLVVSTPLKNMSLSVGIMKFPTEWEKWKKKMFQIVPNHQPVMVNYANYPFSDAFSVGFPIVFLWFSWLSNGSNWRPRPLRIGGQFYRWWYPQCKAPSHYSVQLVRITPISLWFVVLITN